MLHGKPPHIAKAHMAQNLQQGETFTLPPPSAEAFQVMIQELQNLKAMINSSGTIIGSTSMVNSSIREIFFSYSVHPSSLTTAWILDSGATDHMTPSDKYFLSYEQISIVKHVQTVDGTLLQVAGIGTMNIQLLGFITNVLYVPKIFISLISVQRLAKVTKYNILFENFDVYLCHEV